MRHFGADTQVCPYVVALFLQRPSGRRESALIEVEGMKYQDMTDAHLYLGPKASQIIDDTIPPEVLNDEEYRRELDRRGQLQGQGRIRRVR
jgi:hypothetical protein